MNLDKYARIAGFTLKIQMIYIVNLQNATTTPTLPSGKEKKATEL